jgi:hypothetical protein
MPFPASTFFGAALSDSFRRTVALDWDSDTFKVALFNNSMDGSSTFNKNTDAGTYNSGLWVNTNEVSSANYTAGGQNLTTPSVTVSGGKLVWGEANASMAWSNVTFTARGALVYDDTVAPKRGVVAINFGADVPVTAGTFTITWDPTNKIAYVNF